MKVRRFTSTLARRLAVAAVLVPFLCGAVAQGAAQSSGFRVERSGNPDPKLQPRGARERSHTREATDVTVRLFSTQPVQRVTISGSGARIRLCRACAAQPLASRLLIGAGRNGEGLSVAGQTVTQVFVDGSVEAATADGRVAEVAGHWLLSGKREGLHMQVQVPSERYVMAVLQAEASTDEPAESLKALAVVARSFALQNPQRHGDEGLCDSTHCQALRFGAVPARVRAAVEATSGETLWLAASSPGQPRQVSAYFTEDCGGETEDAAALWGGERKPWLVAHADPFCVRAPALWHAELSLMQVRDALVGEGLTLPGTIASMRVAKQDASGRAALIEMAGMGTRLQVSAATLRFALDRAYGWNELRSDLYRLSVANGRVLFEGKGYGHGVGLCQAGARGMAGLGRSYREILAFYFPGTSMRVLADDAGWASRQGSGWGLRAVAGGNEWVSAGDGAWSKARAAFPVSRSVEPVVTVYPTTELFRQATGEPGWELAATRGAKVALQPPAVLKRVSEDPEDLLEHEFLHVLVENEAGPTVPLWLREGLVEVLSGERCAAVRMGPGQVDAGLSAPATQRESQRAHAAACARVGGAVSRYGLGAVRGWLRSGVPAFVMADQ